MVEEENSVCENGFSSEHWIFEGSFEFFATNVARNAKILPSIEMCLL
jgi:hypothetical protein